MGKGDKEAILKEMSAQMDKAVAMIGALRTLKDQAAKLGVDEKIFKDLQKAIDDTKAAYKQAVKKLDAEIAKEGGSGRSPPGRG